MCIPRVPKASTSSPAVAMIDNSQAIEQASIEARLRARRAGAAADILTSPVGIPFTRTLGGKA